MIFSQPLLNRLNSTEAFMENADKRLTTGFRVAATRGSLSIPFGA
jgi:hypothetical protein